MAKFIVLHTPILHDGKRYEVGAEIELTAEQAENNAINLKAVEAVPKPPKNTSKPEDEPKPEGEPKPEDEPKPEGEPKPEDEPKPEGDPKPEDAVTEDDVKLAEAKIAEAEQPKGNKK